jgi:predicted RNA-binding Zn-ribbon protein involved in translation (DUF1610 family)
MDEASQRELFKRATGPRREITDDCDLHCPWCGHDCLGAAHRWREDVHRYITACPECGRDFMCPDARGDNVCVGLISPADQKYLEWKTSQETSL